MGMGGHRDGDRDGTVMERDVIRRGQRRIWAGTGTDGDGMGLETE